MAGHLFIVAGDITRLHCDAWLLPTDDAFGTVGSFRYVFSESMGQQRPPDWLPDERARPLNEPKDGQPAVWLTRVGTAGGTPEHFARCLADFVAEAEPSARTRTQGTRTKPLLASPILGTRRGGGDWRGKGAILEALIVQALSLTAVHDVDIALVTWGEDQAAAQAMHAAAQRVRREVADRTEGGLWPLPDGLAERAAEIAQMARSGRLVLFLGAGVSAAAGLPTWQGLMDELADEADVAEADLPRLRKFDLRDQATIVTNNGRTESARKRIDEALKSDRYPLTTALLAALPSREAITTNYDTMFEAAVKALSQDLVVLPLGAVKDSRQRWLLKLHGDLTGNIVLTREDYLASATSHSALFGLVQAMLLTRHMLFVGYSLSDEDFHRIVRDVRLVREQASDSDQQTPLGTALVLFRDDLQARIWERTIEVLPVAPTGHPGDDAQLEQKIAEASRTQQIFLDLVGHLASDPTAFLLQGDFEQLLKDQDERELASVLRELATIEFEDTGLREKLESLLCAFGGRPTTSS